MVREIQWSTGCGRVGVTDGGPNQKEQSKLMWEAEGLTILDSSLQDRNLSFPSLHQPLLMWKTFTLCSAGGLLVLVLVVKLDSTTLEINQL